MVFYQPPTFLGITSAIRPPNPQATDLFEHTINSAAKLSS
jgi:hypothetical protein